MVDLVEWLTACLDEDERIARAASGGTVVGEPGNWRPAPGGDEWEAFAGDIEEELLVALRPGLPRPPDPMSGMWGAWASNEPDSSDPGAGSSMPALRHAAEHDPARVLREINAKRRTLVRCQEEMFSGIPRLVHFAKQTVREMALPYADRSGYTEALAAFE